MKGEAKSALDRRRVAATFDKAAATYDAHDALQREVARRLLARLDYFRIDPRLIVDLGSGTGRVGRALGRRFRRARVVQCDIAPAMLRRARAEESRLFSRQRFVCADIERLPCREAVFDIAVSSLALQWCEVPGTVFAEARRCLARDGLLLFATLGPDTLKELRAAFESFSREPHVNRFDDMHDLGDALVAQGFADPVLEAEVITVEYRDVLELLRDLKGIGASNAARARARGLFGRHRLAALELAYEAFRRDGVLPATYEVVYGHAWAAGDARPQRGAEGSVHTFPLARLKRG